MSKRNLSLASRKEKSIDKRPIEPVVDFSLSDIKKHFDKTISDIESQFNLVNLLEQEGNKEGAKDILRSQIVFLESALDFYLHEISKYAMVHIFLGDWDKTEKYNNFTMPMNVYAEGYDSPGSTEWLLNYLNQKFSKEVYLSVESMRDQLNMIGICFTPVMKLAFPAKNETESVNKGKEKIAELFKRRNKIVHQSDRSHADAERDDIDKNYVSSFIEIVQNIVSIIHEAAERK